jgi:hypothetical protein
MTSKIICALTLFASTLHACREPGHETHEVIPARIRAASISLANFDTGKRLELIPIPESLPAGAPSDPLWLTADGNVKSWNIMQQCAPDQTGSWKLQNGILIVHLLETHRTPDCMGQPMPFRTRTTHYRILELSCVYGENGRGEGLALSAEKVRFTVLCED